MAGSHFTPPFRRTGFSQADGRQLAVDLLYELISWVEEIDNREDAKIKAGEDEPNMQEVYLNEEPTILRRYIAIVQQSGDPELERGFFSILNHFLAIGVMEGGAAHYNDFITPQPGLKFR